MGLNAYLTRRRVPGKTPECPCGYRAQTPKHTVLFCPLLQERRGQMILEAGTGDWGEITTSRRGLGAVSQWLIQEGVLDQFSLAKEERRERGRGITW